MRSLPTAPSSTLWLPGNSSWGHEGCCSQPDVPPCPVSCHTPPRAAPPCQAAPSASSSLCPCARDTSPGDRARAELRHLQSRVLRGAGDSPSPPHPEGPWYLLPMGCHSLLPQFPHLHSALREGRGRTVGGRGCSKLHLCLRSRTGPSLLSPSPTPPSTGCFHPGGILAPRSLTGGAWGRPLNLRPSQPCQPLPPAPGHSLNLSHPAGVPLPPACPQKANIQGDGLGAAALPVALALSRADTAARLLCKPEPALGM